MEQRFYANGKLLITAEYVVLDGALALACPTQKGQDLVVSPGSDRKISWKSYNQDGTIWFEDIFSFDEICTPDYVEKTDNVRQRLLEILHEGYLKNPGFLDAPGHSVATHLTFDRHWGLGTSSTLISNIADWLKIDPYQLLKDSFGGSGYDIACARHDAPVSYRLQDQKPVVREVAFRPSFQNNLFFVYLNRKQSSKAAVASYYANRLDHPELLVSQISKITQAVINASDLKTLVYQLEKHESLMSRLLEMNTVKEAIFPDFDGLVKSLGGWGGDFVMVACKQDPTSYFKDRGFHTVVPFSEMIL